MVKESSSTLRQLGNIVIWLGSVLGIGAILSAVVVSYIGTPEESACQVRSYFGLGEPPIPMDAAMSTPRVLISVHQGGAFQHFSEYFNTNEVPRITKLDFGHYAA
jgi:hypothetical protein